MKLLIATRADNNIKEMTNLTHPIIKRFASQWKADFLILKYIADRTDKWGKIHYRIMELYDLLEKYDRIMNLDSDTIINKNCPNLFEIVPYDKVGTMFEDKGRRQQIRWQRIADIQAAWGKIGWKKNYINTGVFLVSKPHAEIFEKFNGKLWTAKGYDDVHLGYQINRLGIEIYELNYKFNHMCMFSEQWNGSPSRFDSYILHYAGHAKFPDKGKRNKVQQIKDDIRRIYGTR